MPLLDAEIAPGAIAYFDIELLHKDSAVSVSGDPVQRAGNGNQFVCYKADEGISYWAPLTASQRTERLKIQAKWVSNGYGPLAGGKVCLQDGKNTYRGPNASFIAASISERPFNGARPLISTDGLISIEATIRARGGLV